MKSSSSQKWLNNVSCSNMDIVKYCFLQQSCLWFSFYEILLKSKMTEQWNLLEFGYFEILQQKKIVACSKMDVIPLIHRWAYQIKPDTIISDSFEGCSTVDYRLYDRLGKTWPIDQVQSQLKKIDQCSPSRSIFNGCFRSIDMLDILLMDEQTSEFSLQRHS